MLPQTGLAHGRYLAIKLKLTSFFIVCGDGVPIAVKVAHDVFFAMAITAGSYIEVYIYIDAFEQ